MKTGVVRVAAMGRREGLNWFEGAGMTISIYVINPDGSTGLEEMRDGRILTRGNDR